MKKFITAFIFCVTIVNGFSQNVAINTSGLNADASAMLDIASSSKGLLTPRMTTAQRTAISSPANGLLVFDTDTKTFWFFSTSWKELTTGGGGGNFSLPYSGTFAGSNPALSISNTSTPLGNGINVEANGSSASAIKALGQGSSQSAATIVGTNNGGGPGVLGISGSSGFGYGVMGQANAGIAGYFLKSGNSNVGYCIAVTDQTMGTGVKIAMVDQGNNSPALEIVHSGTGKLASYSKGGSEVAFVGNNGNLNTNGSVIVKGNKGIVRSSTATQMRYETISTSTFTSIGLGVGGSLSMNVTFSTAFSSAPAVSVANINTGYIGPCDVLSVAITNVTTTGCTVKIVNPFMATTGVISGSWKLLIVGPE